MSEREGSQQERTPRLLVIGTGGQAYREYLLASIGARYDVHLFLGAEPTWEREPDGRERIVARDVLERWEKDGRVESRLRRREVRVLADDMPWITRQYLGFRAGQSIEAS